MIIKIPPNTKELYAIPVNDKSIPFSSCYGLKFNSSATNAVISKFHSNQAEITRNIQATEYSITVNVFNEVFLVSKTIEIDIFTITPKSPTVLLGTYLQMNTTAMNPSWSSSQSKNIPISSNGLLHAKKQGVSIISNGQNSNTNVTVVKIEKLDIEPISHTTVRINPVLDIKSIDFNAVVVPEDLKFDCSISSGSATPIRNASGLFCLYSTKSSVYTISATLKSYSTKLSISASQKLKAIKNFLLPDGYKVKLSQTKREASVQVAPNNTKAILAENTTPGLSVSFSQQTGFVDLLISEEFSNETKGTLVFKMPEKEILHVDVEWDNAIAKVMAPKKKAHTMPFFFTICLIISVCSIFVILLQLGFA